MNESLFKTFDFIAFSPIKMHPQTFVDYCDGHH